MRLFFIMISFLSVLLASETSDFMEFNLRRFSYIGDIAKVKRALSEGARIDAKDDEGMSALLWAAYKDHEAIVQWLVEQGADTTLKSQSGRTILSYAIQNKNESLVRYLLDKNVPLIKDASFLNSVYHAISTPTFNGAVSFLAFEKDMNHYYTLFPQDAYRKTHTTLLLGAINAKNLELARILIRNGANINLSNSRGETPLLCAMRTKQYAFAKELIALGAHLSVADSAGNTLLSYAIKAKQHDLALSAIDATDLSVRLSQKIVETKYYYDEEDIAASKPEDRIYTYLQMAALYDEVDVAHALLAIGERLEDVMQTESLRLDALGIAVSHNHVTMTRFLLEKGANPFLTYHNKQVQGNSGLYYFAGGYSTYTLFDLAAMKAIQEHDTTVLNLLIALPTSQHFAAIEGDTFYKNIASLLFVAEKEELPLLHTIENALLSWDKERYMHIKTATFEMLKTMEQKSTHNTQPKEDTSTPAYRINNAIREGNIAHLKALQKEGILIAKVYPEALHIAIMHDHTELIDPLVNLGLDINAIWSDKSVPLMLMSYLYKQPERLQSLLARVISLGADINNKSLLMEYISHQHQYDKQLLPFLLSQGADFGKTYYVTARLFEKGNEKILKQILADATLKELLLRSITHSDATQIAIQLIKYNDNDKNTKGLEQLFQLCYEHTIPLEYMRVFEYKNASLRVRRLAMFYMPFKGW